MTLPRPRLTRRFAATFGGGLFAMLLGILGHAEVLALGGGLAALLAAVGASVPRASRIQAGVTVGHDTANEDETVAAQLRFSSEGRGHHLLEWRLRLPALARLHAGASVGVASTGRGDHASDVEVSLPLFGLHRLGPLDWRAGDPFGFAALEQSQGEAAELRVYPKAKVAAPVDVRSRQMRPLHGLHEIAQPGDGFEFFGLRDYQVGDRPRDINWKASAKYGHIYVNQHQRESEAEIVLLVDTRAATLLGPLTQTPFAQSCRAALAVAEECFGARDRVRLVAYGDGTHEDRHTGPHRRLQGILDMMVGLEPAGATSLREVVEQILPSLRRRTPIVLFSPLVGDAGLLDALTTLRSRDFAVQVVLTSPPTTAEEGDAQVLWRAVQHHMAFQVREQGVPTHTMPHAPAVRPPEEAAARA